MNSAGNVVATTVTDVSGCFVFSGVPDGTYSVVEEDPIGNPLPLISVYDSTLPLDDSTAKVVLPGSQTQELCFVDR